MSILNKTYRSIFVGGALFVVPLTVLILIFGKFLSIIRPLVQWFNDTLGVHRILGLAAISITSIFLLLLICFLAGMLIKVGFLRSWGSPVEEFLFRLFPSLQMLKFRVMSENDIKKTVWIPILLDDEFGKRIAFITDDRDEKYLSIFVPDAPRMDAGEVRIVERNIVKFQEITMKQAVNGIFHYGRGIMTALNTHKG